VSEAGRDDREFLDASGIDPDSFDHPDRRRDEVAGIAQRAFARSIDLLVVGVIGLAIVSATGGVDADGTISRGVQVATLLGWLAYEGVTTALLGATMGKMAVGVKVVDARRGARPGLARCLLRAAVVPGAAAVVGVFGLALYSTAAADARSHRGIPDRVAGTAVVRA
jgi:uncharacterized RDD family membrane protein YckC